MSTTGRLRELAIHNCPITSSPKLKFTTLACMTAPRPLAAAFARANQIAGSGLERRAEGHQTQRLEQHLRPGLRGVGAAVVLR